MTAIRDLLHWLVDHVEARPEDRAGAHELADQAHPADPAPDAAPGPADPAPDGAQGAPERGPEPGEGGGQA